jgi:ABC-type phosphate/phosphonate transport system substrate-binding protein
MTNRKLTKGLTLVFLTTALASLSRAGENDVATTGTIRIGIVRSLFRNTPEPLMTAMMRPFGALMESQTGIAGELVPSGDALELGKLLANDKVQIGVFHGIEFAWARQQVPQLRPLMLAVNQARHLHACLVARADSSAACLGDLKAKRVAFPRQSREHCRLFLEQRCRCQGQCVDDYFCPLTQPATAEDALDDVVDHVTDAAIVDGLALESFARRKPGRFDRLKIIERSATFPAAVLAYVPGTLDEATLRSMRDGLQGANKTALGRQFLTLWKLTAFEPVAADYEQTLSDILKVYPQPLAHRLN